MQTPDRGAWRLVRAGAVASTVVGLAVAAHVAAGGRLPGPGLLLALTSLVGCVALLVTGRRATRRTLLAVLGAGQLGLHEAFCWFGVATHAVHGQGHHGAVEPAGTLVGVAHGAAPTPADGWTAAAHALATVLAALALARGEDLLWRVRSWWRPVRALALAGLHLPVAPRVPRPPAVVLPRPSSVVARRVPRRGPPGVPALASTTGHTPGEPRCPVRPCAPPCPPAACPPAAWSAA